MPSFLKLILALALIANVQASPVVTETRFFQHPETGVVILGGDVTLPSAGVWSVAQQDAPGIRELLLIVPDLIKERSKGERALKQRETAERNKDRYALQRIYAAAERFAREHDGFSPTSFDELNARDIPKTEEGKSHFLVPLVKILERKNERWQRLPGKALVLELNPLIDDGQHWVTTSDGLVSLTPIDPAMIQKFGLNIRARQTSVEERLAEIATAARYRIIGRTAPEGVEYPTSVQLFNRETGETLQVDWPMDKKAKGEEALLKHWASARIGQWREMQQAGLSGFLPYWIMAAKKQYGVDPKDISRANRLNRRRDDRQASLFNVLGGRAALRETLQLQRIDAGRTSHSNFKIPITSIKGVEVKSHPFEEMLAGQVGGQLDLANAVPVDRFFAYFAKPKALLQYMDGGSDFVFHSGASLTGKSNDYQLNRRYLGRLGVDEIWARRFLASGIVGDLAVVLPDLFLIDGTDMTVLMRLHQPALAKGMLKLLGFTEWKHGIERANKDGSNSYWSLQDDLLLVSTSRHELERIQQLRITGNGSSLGRSAEFRYMLTQLPIGEKTRSYFYFSDPFIRRLVGPQVKIAQLRRLQARAEMEAATAASLLYRLDGNTGLPSLDELVAKQYMPAPVLVKDMTLATNDSVYSPTYGNPANLHTLLSQPINAVSESEKRAYGTYLNNYNRFWRRFFDPIAVRVNQLSEKEMEVSTFILPLIDNSIYQILRDILVVKEGSGRLSVPLLKPEPVAQLSLNMNEEMWEEGTEMVQEFLVKLVGIPPRVSDFFGPDLHLALGDGDPIIVMGSGELTSALGLLDGGNRGGEALMIPLIGALLTRPSVLLIGLTDPDAVRRLLRSLSAGPSSRSSIMGMGAGTLYGVAGKDAWRYDLNIAGLLSMRFGMEVKDRYLVISNQPLSYDPELFAVDTAINNGAAISLSPGAAIRQRPALFASASDKQRQAAMSGIGVLYPLLAAGANSVEQAQEQVEQLLGYRPIHPGRGKWQWKDSALSSSVFGNPRQQYQADYESDSETFGLLRRVKRLQMNMQFEDDGLRASARWELAD